MKEHITHIASSQGDGAAGEAPSTRELIDRLGAAVETHDELAAGSVPREHFAEFLKGDEVAPYTAAEFLAEVPTLRLHAALQRTATKHALTKLIVTASAGIEAMSRVRTDDRCFNGDEQGGSAAVVTRNPDEDVSGHITNALQLLRADGLTSAHGGTITFDSEDVVAIERRLTWALEQLAAEASDRREVLALAGSGRAGAR